MRLPSSAVFLALFIACAFPVFADKPDEAALQDLWAAQQKDPGTHAALAQNAGNRVEGNVFEDNGYLAGKL